MTSRLDAIQLVPEKWEWAHHTSHEWKEIPNADEPQNIGKLFLFPVHGADRIHEYPFENGPAYMHRKPSKKWQVPFMAFLKADSSPESFLEFANTYGHLLVTPISVDNGRSAIWTSSLDLWIEEHWRFTLAYRLWQAIKSNDASAIDHLIHMTPTQVREKTVIIFNIPQVPKRLENDCSIENVQPLFEFENPPFSQINRVVDHDGRSCSITFTFEVNERTGTLTAHDIAAWCFHWLCNGQLKQYPTEVQLEYAGKNKFSQCLWPQNLLASMWMHFFQTVTEERKIARCIICGRWSDITNEKRGKKPWDRHRDCANSDGVEKHRKFPKIKEMLSAGHSLTEAAQNLNVEVPTLERWLKEEGEAEEK